MATTSTTSVTEAHKVMVGILILIVMLVIFVEVAGTSHNNAVMVGLLLLGPLLLLGFNHKSNLASWASSNPFNP